MKSKPNPDNSKLTSLAEHTQMMEPGKRLFGEEKPAHEISNRSFSTHPYLLQHGCHPKVRQECLLKQFEEEIPVLNAVDTFKEESHALLVVGD